MINLDSTQYEPKVISRFLVKFPKQFNINEWVIQKCNKPKLINGNWENIKIEFIDPINISTSQSLFKIVEFITTNKSDNKKMFDITIESLDSTGFVIEQWIISVKKVLIIDFGELDCNDDKMQQPFIVVKPLKCILKM